MPIDVTDNYVRVRQSNPGNFKSGSLRTIMIDKGKGIKAVIGKPKGGGGTKIQTVLFPKKSFTVAQAKKWLKDHDMKTEEILQEAVWTTKYVNDLDDGSFLYIDKSKVTGKDSDGKSVPRSARHFPYKDKSGDVDKIHLRNALSRIPQSNLFPDVKKRVAAKARSIAKNNGIDVSEEFLDPVNLLWPISYPAIFETLVEFNAGALYECGYYGWDQVSTYGRKLARKMTQMVNSSIYDDEYDEEGRPTNSSTQSDSQTTTTYKFHDGQVIVVRSSGASDNGMEWEYSDGGEEASAEEDSKKNIEKDTEAVAETDEILEAYTTGGMIKAMRTKKKMSRTDMAANMSMSKARLTELEDDVDEPDDDELADIAGALGMTPKRMRKMMDAMLGGDDDDSDEAAEETVDFYEIIGEETVEAEVYDIVEIAANVVETAKAEKDILIFTNQVYEERVFHGETVETHRLIGDFIAESFEEKADGTLKFDVPLFKIGELTSNGNRYTKKCAENLINDLGALRKKYVKKESSHKRTVLDIGLGESVEGMTPKEIEAEIDDYMNGRTPDMLATHRARMGQGNPLLETAGVIIGGRIGEIEGDPTFFLKGETIETSAGRDISVLIKRKMLRGVSLFGLPTEFEENDDGGSDVDRMRLVGTDFTNDGGNLIQFRDKKNAGFAVLN